MILLAALSLVTLRVSLEPRCPSCSRVSDAEFCAMQTRAVTDLKPKLPMHIDKITWVTGMVVVCSLRATTMNRSIAAKPSQMRPGWQAMAQSQLDETICGNPLFVVMARRGWRFSQNLTFIGGARVEQSAVCPQ